MIVVRRKLANYRTGKTERPREPADPTPQHPYVELGNGATAIWYATEILKREGRLIIHYGNEWLDGKPATPNRKVIAANQVLKRLGLPQRDVPGCRQ